MLHFLEPIFETWPIRSCIYRILHCLLAPFSWFDDFIDREVPSSGVLLNAFPCSLSVTVDDENLYVFCHLRIFSLTWYVLLMTFNRYSSKYVGYAHINQNAILYTLHIPYYVENKDINNKWS